MITDRGIILVLGAIMAALGLTGILRGESGAVSTRERRTAMGRALAVILSSIWLLTGALYLIGGALDEPRRYDVIGYSSLIAMLAFLTVLTVALLLFFLLSLLRRPRPRLPQPSVTLPPPRHYHFRHLDPVIHPEMGKGFVLDSYFHDGQEMVSVLFRDERLNIPADQLETRPG